MSPRRIVVAAPYPIMPGPESAATFSYVRRLMAEGADVTVVSPVPSAAHHFANPIGPRSAVKLGRLAKGADLLHLRLDANAQAVEQDSPRLLVTRLGLQAVVRQAKRTEIRLDRVPTTVGRKWATLVLGAASEILVATDDERSSLVSAGVPFFKITVGPEPEMAAAAEPPVRHLNVDPMEPGASVADLQDLVRRRAAEDRTSRRRASASTEVPASLSLRHLVRMERPSARSNVPGGAFVKRLVAKVLNWQFDNVIGSVNRLHQATIDAIETLEDRQAGGTERTTS